VHLLPCLARNRLKQEINVLLIHIVKKKSLEIIIMNNLDDCFYAEKSACQFCEFIFPNQSFISLNLPKTWPQLQ